MALPLVQLGEVGKADRRDHGAGIVADRRRQRAHADAELAPVLCPAVAADAVELSS